MRISAEGSDEVPRLGCCASWRHRSRWWSAPGWNWYPLDLWHVHRVGVREQGGEALGIGRFLGVVDLLEQAAPQLINDVAEPEAEVEENGATVMPSARMSTRSASRMKVRLGRCTFPRPRPCPAAELCRPGRGWRRRWGGRETLRTAHGPVHRAPARCAPEQRRGERRADRPAGVSAPRASRAAPDQGVSTRPANLDEQGPRPVSVLRILRASCC